MLLDCTVGPHIKPEGWHDWSKPIFHTEGFYAEHGTQGVTGPRAAFARTLTDEEAQAYTYGAFLSSL